MLKKRAQFQPHPDQLDLEDHIQAMTEEETERSHDAALNIGSVETLQPCDHPPEGWFCTRVKGHPGPCAAHPGFRLPSGAPVDHLDPFTRPQPLPSTGQPADAPQSASRPLTQNAAQTYPDDFSNYPTTLNENTNDSSKWSPRDVLIAALRAYDSGKTPKDVQTCIVIMSGSLEDPDSDLDFWQKSNSRGSLHGVIERMRLKLYALAFGV